MENPETKTSPAEVQNFRKGLVVFGLLLIVVVLAGLYLRQESRLLDQQYQHILNNSLPASR